MDEANDVHARQVSAVRDAVANLLPAFAPAGFTPEAIFEGAVRGGALILLAATPAGAADVGDLLKTMGDGFFHLAKPKLSIVACDVPSVRGGEDRPA